MLGWNRWSINHALKAYVAETHKLQRSSALSGRKKKKLSKWVWPHTQRQGHTLFKSCFSRERRGGKGSVAETGDNLCFSPHAREGRYGSLQQQGESREGRKSLAVSTACIWYIPISRTTTKELRESGRATPPYPTLSLSLSESLHVKWCVVLHQSLYSALTIFSVSYVEWSTNAAKITYSRYIPSICRVEFLKYFDKNTRGLQDVRATRTY